MADIVKHGNVGRTEALTNLVKTENKMASLMEDILVVRSEQRDLQRKIQMKIENERKELSDLGKTLRKKQAELLVVMGGRNELRKLLRLSGDNTVSNKLNKILSSEESQKLLEVNA